MAGVVALVLQVSDSVELRMVTFLRKLKVKEYLLTTGKKIKIPNPKLCIFENTTQTRSSSKMP